VLGLTMALGALVLLGFGFVLLAPRRHGALGELGEAGLLEYNQAHIINAVSLPA